MEAAIETLLELITLDNILVNVSYLFYFVAILVRDIFWLRLFALLSSAVLVVFGIMLSIKSMIIWSAAFVILNLYHIIKIIIAKWPVVLSDDLLKFYSKIFSSLPKSEFLRFWRLGNLMSFNNEPIPLQDTNTDNLYLILDGEVSVKNSKKSKELLVSSQFIGEQLLFSEQGMDCSVRSIGKTVVIKWTREAMNQLQNDNPKLYSRLTSAIIAGLKTKLIH